MRLKGCLDLLYAHIVGEICDDPCFQDYVVDVLARVLDPVQMPDISVLEVLFLERNVNEKLRGFVVDTMFKHQRRMLAVLRGERMESESTAVSAGVLAFEVCKYHIHDENGSCYRDFVGFSGVRQRGAGKMNKRSERSAEKERVTPHFDNDIQSNHITADLLGKMEYVPVGNDGSLFGTGISHSEYLLPEPADMFTLYASTCTMPSEFLQRLNRTHPSATAVSALNFDKPLPPLPLPQFPKKSSLLSKPSNWHQTENPNTTHHLITAFLIRISLSRLWKIIPNMGDQDNLDMWIAEATLKIYGPEGKPKTVEIQKKLDRRDYRLSLSGRNRYLDKPEPLAIVKERPKLIRGLPIYNPSTASTPTLSPIAEESPLFALNVEPDLALFPEPLFSGTSSSRSRNVRSTHEPCSSSSSSVRGAVSQQTQAQIQRKPVPLRGEDWMQQMETLHALQVTQGFEMRKPIGDGKNGNRKGKKGTGVIYLKDVVGRGLALD